MEPQRLRAKLAVNIRRGIQNFLLDRSGIDKRFNIGLFEKSGRYIGVGGNLACLGLKRPCKQFQQRCFALAVSPDNAYPVAGGNADGKIPDKGLAGSIAEGNVPHRHHIFAAVGFFTERKIKVLYLFQPIALAHFCKAFDARLHHAGKTGLGAEAGDKKLYFFFTPLIIDARLFIHFLLQAQAGNNRFPYCPKFCGPGGGECRRHGSRFCP